MLYMALAIVGTLAAVIFTLRNSFTDQEDYTKNWEVM